MAGQRTRFDGQLLITLQRSCNIYFGKDIIPPCSHRRVAVVMTSPIDSCLSQESLRLESIAPFARQFVERFQDLLRPATWLILLPNKLPGPDVPGLIDLRGEVLTQPLTASWKLDSIADARVQASYPRTIASMTRAIELLCLHQLNEGIQLEIITSIPYRVLSRFQPCLLIEKVILPFKMRHAKGNCGRKWGGRHEVDTVARSRNGSDLSKGQ